MLYVLNPSRLSLKSLRRFVAEKHQITFAEGLNHMGTRGQLGLDLTVRSTGIGSMLLTNHLDIMVRSIFHPFLKANGLYCLNNLTFILLLVLEVDSMIQFLRDVSVSLHILDWTLMCCFPVFSREIYFSVLQYLGRCECLGTSKRVVLAYSKTHVAVHSALGCTQEENPAGAETLVARYHMLTSKLLSDFLQECNCILIRSFLWRGF